MRFSRIKFLILANLVREAAEQKVVEATADRGGQVLLVER